MAEAHKNLFIGVGFLVASTVLASFVLVTQVQARQGADDDSVSSDTSAGLKLRGDGTVDDDQPGLGADVQLQAQNQVKLRGDGTVDDSQKGVEDDEDEDNDDSNTRGQERSAERRSAVANFIQRLKDVADKEEGGLGEQVRAIARQQEESNQTSAVAMVNVQAKGKIRTFLFGSDYKNLGKMRREVVQTRNRLTQLNGVLANLESDEDKAEIQSQIEILEQEQVKIDNFIQTKESQMSLFGWVARLFNK